MQVRDCLQPVTLLHGRATLAEALDSLEREIPVFVSATKGWAFMRPQAVVGYPRTRRMIDLPLEQVQPIAPDTELDQVAWTPESSPIAVEEFGKIIGCLNPIRLYRWQASDRATDDHGLLLRVVEPLTHDLANALFALEASLSPQADADSQACQAAIKHTSALLVRLRAICSGAIEAAPDRIDVKTVLEEMYDLLQLVCGSGVRVLLNTHQPLPRVRAYERSLERALLNLVLNACEAMHHKGELHVSAHFEEDRSAPCVVICVEDDGPGLSRPIAAQMFDRGFTSKPGDGRGLGLDSVVQAMSRVGGSVRSRPSTLGGAAFELRFFAVS